MGAGCGPGGGSGGAARRTLTSAHASVSPAATFTVTDEPGCTATGGPLPAQQPIELSYRSGSVPSAARWATVTGPGDTATGPATVRFPAAAAATWPSTSRSNRPRSDAG